MAKKIQTGTAIHVKTTAGRIRHAIVKTVTNQNSLTVQIGKGTAFAVTRAASTTTRGTQFNQ
jgi:preprotein translocase subunit YajC